MNYVDANILIYALNDETKKGAASRLLLKNDRLTTSTLSLDEVAYALRKHSVEEALEGVETLSNSPNLVFVAFLPEDIDSFKKFLSIGLYPRDAIHALTASKVKAAIIYSEDSDFDKLPIKRKTPW